jgi:hypothetical protein
MKTISKRMMLFSAIVFCVATAFAAETMYQEDKSEYDSVQGPPTCKWRKFNHLFCSQCSWYLVCSCDPNDPNDNLRTQLGEGFTSPVVSTTTISAEVCGGTVDEANSQMQAGAFDKENPVQKNYAWCIKYKYTRTEYKSCGDPSF